MNSEMNAHLSRTGALGWLLVVAVAINLRPILTSIGPLLEEIRNSTGLGYQQAALLTALPVLCMGLVPLLQPWLRRWLSEHHGMLAGLAAIALACTWRLFLHSGTALIASAALAGLGVAFIQALMPGLVNRWFPSRLALAMGVYSAALMSGGGIAATGRRGLGCGCYRRCWPWSCGAWRAPARSRRVVGQRPGDTFSAAAVRGCWRATLA